MRYTGEQTFESYMERIRELFSDDETYVIWGSKWRAAVAREKVANVLFHVDNDKNKWGGLIDGLEIRNPEVLKEYPDVKIIVASAAYQQISEQLNSYGIPEENYCDYREWYTIKEYLAKGALSLPEMNFVTNNVCSLSCRGCMVYVPYIQRKRNFPLEEIVASIDHVFEYVDFSEVVGFAGGETLLHDGLGEMIEYCYDRYVMAGRVNHIQILTNGTLIPGKELLQVFKRCHVRVFISDYRNAVSGRCRMDEIVECLDAEGISYVINNQFTRAEEGKWFDMGNPFSCHNMTDRELERHYDKCAKICFSVYDSRFFNCSSVMHSIASLGRTGTSNDYCDLRTDSKAKFLKYYLGYNDKGYYDFCDFCNGFGEAVNKTSITAGEQTG